jgi:hypothetical protein
MAKEYKVELIQDHFIINDNGTRALIDTGCPFTINESNKKQIPGGAQHLESVRQMVDANIEEFRGLEYFKQHKVLFDYKNAKVIVASANEELSVDNPVAKFPLINSAGLPRIIISMNIEGVNRNLIFDTGASIANYMTESIAKTGKPAGTVIDFHPQLGKYKVKLYDLSIDIGGEKVSIPFGIQPDEVDRDVQSSNAVGVIGVGLYKNYQVLVDIPGNKLVLGK